MKKSISIMLIFLLLITLSGCSDKKENSEAFEQKDLTIGNLSEQYQNAIQIEIDQKSIANGIATVKVTLPDLIRLFDEEMSNKGPDNESEITDAILKNLKKYSTTYEVQTEVEKVKGKWEIKSYEAISTCIDDSWNGFIWYHLSQVEFTPINVEVE